MKLRWSPQNQFRTVIFTRASLQPPPVLSVWGVLLGKPFLPRKGALLAGGEAPFPFPLFLLLEGLLSFTLKTTRHQSKRKYTRSEKSSPGVCNSVLPSLLAHWLMPPAQYIMCRVYIKNSLIKEWFSLAGTRKCKLLPPFRPGKVLPFTCRFGSWALQRRVWIQGVRSHCRGWFQA